MRERVTAKRRVGRNELLGCMRVVGAHFPGLPMGSWGCESCLAYEEAFCSGCGLTWDQVGSCMRGKYEMGEILKGVSDE